MKLLKKIDDNLLKGLITLFIFFIPLYPKFPFHTVYTTYIAIRFDDFLIALITGVFFIQLIRGKIKLKDLKFTKPFLIFWAIVAASFLSGYFLTQTIDYLHIGFLHAARRIQYMIVFFIATAAVKSVKDFKYYFYVLLSSIFLVILYGIGQRMYNFPAISTMNPEFAKGRVLYLTPEARLSSTFAGHYDLGAFMVFMFPILWGLYFTGIKLTQSIKTRLWIFLTGALPFVLMIYNLGKAAFEGPILTVFLIGLFDPLYSVIFVSMLSALALYLAFNEKKQHWVILGIILFSIVILVSTASRTSSIAYIVSTFPFLLYFRKFRYLLLSILLTAGLTYLDADLVKRWASTVQIRQIIINEKTGERVVVQELKPNELPAGTAFVKSKKKADNNDPNANKIRQELIDRATMSGKLKSATDQAKTDGSSDDEVTEDDYETINAIAADISIATRFEISWPRAVQAFLSNPLLGTGPSSITESTDGDYFRWIGELGALGTAAFLYVLFVVHKYLYEARTRLPKKARYLIYGVLFGTFGLMVNAILIDVFEASKVAYMFWLMLGLFVGLLNRSDSELKKLTS